jgi:ABC-type nitrate/sulfonate/bicarbonate transport system substrate-binding protein
METIKLALDWTPNINHIGFFVARSKGFYADAGIDVEITDPSIDNYELTPAKKVELWRADFALCPTESIISYRTKAAPFDLTAVAALFDDDMSAIVVKGDSDVQSPKDLDGKSYASYKARYEDQIVKQMVRNDGGQGNIQVVYPEKLGIWETIVNNKYDATWIFTNWEGVQAKSMSVDLRMFKMEDFNVPYSYSPVLAASAEKIVEREGAYRNFLKATKQGFLYAKAHPEEAAEILKPLVAASDRDIDIVKAIEVSAPAMGDDVSWGRMNEDVVKTFLEWIYRHKLEDQRLSVNQLMTNRLLES